VSFKSDLNKKVDQFTRNKKSKKGSVTTVSSTDLDGDLKRLTSEMARQVCPTAVGRCGTIVRKRAQQIVRQGGNETTIGRSYKTMTRGLPDGSAMKNIGRGSWSKKISDKRGTGGKSLADPGGIIKRPIRRLEKGLVSSQIVGPRYEAGDKGKNFAHVHEPADGKRAVHKYWHPNPKTPIRLGKSSGLHKVRPFMGPAGKLTLGEQRRAIKEALKKWDIRESDFIR